MKTKKMIKEQYFFISEHGFNSNILEFEFEFYRD